MKLQVYQVDSFTKCKFSGNPAGVVPHADGLTEKQMQQIAREFNNSETAFIFSPTATDHDVHVRFFTPGVEVPLCGHATIAAHYIRAIEKNLPTTTVIQKTGAGILPVDIIKEDKDYKIWMTQSTPSFAEPFAGINRQVIVNALGLVENDLVEEAPVQFVDTGHGKVMICIKSRKQLNELNPDFTRLAEFSTVTGYKGYFVFTLDSDDDNVLTHGRMFAPAIGINEDPVTGNAHGPLGAYLVKHNLVDHDGSLFSFTGIQGEAMGRPGTVDVEVQINNGESERVKIGGYAVVVFQTTIEI